MLAKLMFRSAAAFRRPWPIVIAAVAVVVLFGLKIPHLRFDNDIRGMLPANNRDLVVNDYYNSEALFGSSDQIFVGIESADAYAESSLRYVKAVQEAIEGLNNVIPAQAMASALGLTDDEGRKVVEALRTVGIGQANYQETLVPLVTSAAELRSRFGWDEPFAAKVARAAALVPPATLFARYENPISKTQSLINADYVAFEDDALVVKQLVEDGELTPEHIDGLKARVAGWSIYHDALVSRDGTLSTILVDLNVRDADGKATISTAISDLVAKHENPAFRAYVDGESVIESAISSSMFADVRLLLPVVAVVILVALYLCFRSIRAVLYPAAIVVVASVFTLGLMAWCNVPISIVGTTIPVLLVAIVAAYGIHQMNHYLQDPATDKYEILSRNMKSVGLAVLLSGLTVMIGFGALAIEAFVPIKNFGIFTAIGDLVGVFGALYVLPAIILLSRHPKTEVTREPHGGLIGRMLRGFVAINRKHSLAAVLGTVGLSVGCAVAMLAVKTELNNVSFFKKSSAIRQADDHLNEKLAGTMVLNLVLDSDTSDPYARANRPAAENEPVDIATPEVLRAIDRLDRDVRRQFPFVTKVVSFNDVLKKMNQEMNGGRREDYVIPEGKDLISQYLLVFTGDIKNVISSNHDKLRVALYLKRVPTSDVERVRKYCAGYFSKEFLQSHHLRAEVTGTANLYNVANRLLVDGMIESIAVCLAIVLLLLAVVLRNVRMSLVAITPILVSLLVNFGALGALGIPLNVGTAIVSSIAIGIGVDFSIHFITWYRHELQRERDINAALEATITHKGRAILYNMVVIVCGFVVLTLSNFVPLVQFGALVALCMVITTLGALVLVPAVIRLLATRERPYLYLGVAAASTSAAGAATTGASEAPSEYTELSASSVTGV